MCLPAVALGAANALASNPRSLGVPTMIVTGNIGKVGVCIVELLKSKRNCQQAK
eukprot:SAG11_NODE_33389_length_277_cov_1.455056_1_plen_53_part_01